MCYQIQLYLFQNCFEKSVLTAYCFCGDTKFGCPALFFYNMENSKNIFELSVLEKLGEKYLLLQ